MLCQPKSPGSLDNDDATSECDIQHHVEHDNFKMKKKNKKRLLFLDAFRRSKTLKFGQSHDKISCRSRVAQSDMIMDASSQEDSLIGQHYQPRTSPNQHQHHHNDGSDSKCHDMRELHITVIEGSDLAAADKNDLSDPYVKVKLGKMHFKTKTISKTLEPKWLETFYARLSHAGNHNNKTILQVFDRDFGSKDDHLGVVSLDFSDMQIGETRDQWCTLSNIDKGRLHVKLKMVSGTSNRIRRSSSSRKLGAQGRLSVTVIEGKELFSKKVPIDRTYVRIKVSKNKLKTRISDKNQNPEYKERFDMVISNYLIDELEMTIYQVNFGTKDIYIGRHTSALKTLKQDYTHDMWLPLDSHGKLHVLLTLTTCEEEEDDVSSITPLGTRFIDRNFKNFTNIGSLKLTIYRGCNLLSADIGGSSDPFVIVELGNKQRRTDTIHNTLNPEWNKTFYMNILDLHSVLEFKVFDEDRGSDDFLGTAHVPLIWLLDGNEKTIVLKNKDLCSRNKGTLVIRGEIDYSIFKACLRCITPQPVKYLEYSEKFRIKTFKRNIVRLSCIVRGLSTSLSSVRDIFQWKNPVTSALAFMFWILNCLFFELWWIPFGFTLLMLRNMWYATPVNMYCDEDPSISCDECDENSDDHEYDGGEVINDDNIQRKERIPKSTIRRKLLAIERICTKIQNVLDTVVSFFERIYNIFSWTTPFFSKLLLFLAICATILLYFVPVRIILLLWGINKFTKKFRVPANYVPNNEVMDFLSRIPNRMQMIEQAPLKPLSFQNKH